GQVGEPPLVSVPSQCGTDSSTDVSGTSGDHCLSTGARSGFGVLCHTNSCAVVGLAGSTTGVVGGGLEPLGAHEDDRITLRGLVRSPPSAACDHPRLNFCSPTR